MLASRGAWAERMAGDLDDLKAMWHELRSYVDRLAGEREQFLDFFEQATEAYLVTDTLGRIETVNGAAVDVLHRRKKFLRGKPLAVLVALEQRTDFRRRLRALSRPGAERSWRAVFEAPEARMEVALTARPIGEDGDGGIFWRLQPAP